MSPVLSTTKKRIRLLAASAVLAALIFLFCAYLPRIPFPGGYVHLGDALIYFAACILPTPYACAAAAIGAALSDALTGYIIWAPGTAVIKLLMALMFSSTAPRIFSKRNILGIIPAGVICVAGYYLYEAILTQSFTVPLASVYFNLLQAAASGVLFIFIALLTKSADPRKILGL